MENRSFFKENRAILCMIPVFLILFLLVSVLYGIRKEYVSYIVIIYLILDIIAMVIQYCHYKKSREIDEKYLKDLEAEKNAQSKWEMIQEKQDFFALWAHQIKTPIAALNLLLQGEKPDSAASRQELFKIESYVEMAINYLRFEEMSNDLVLEKYQLDTLVRQVVKKNATIFIYRHISVKLENLNAVILTDEKWFCFVLEQILSNALKYTNQGSVTISAQQCKEEIRVIVKDTGIGIKSEDLPRIFEKGFTGYNGRMDKKASGLGLYLCKGVCGKLGHKIEVQSREGEGTTVILILPYEKVEQRDLRKT